MMMTERIERCFFPFLMVAIAVLGWGLLKLSQARLYQPAEPVKAARNSFNFSRKEPVFPLERYQALLSGDLFFGPVPPEVTPPPPVFTSELIVMGITKETNAKNGYAVIGLKSTGDSRTWIATTGMEIAGEKILQIKEDYLIVRNKTGTGKVLLRN